MKNIVIASVNQACQIAGGQRALAKQLRISYGQVHQWAAGTRSVPIRYCQRIVELTKGAVTLQSLRPIDWYLVWPDAQDTTQDSKAKDQKDPNEEES